MAVWTLIADYVKSYVFAYQDANEIVGNLVALASVGLRKPLGGSRTTSVPLIASAQNAVDWQDVTFRAVPAGFTYVADVEVRTDNATTTVTPKIRNVTDSMDAVVGVACAATAADYSGTSSKQTLTFVPLANKLYRLQLTPSDANNPVYGIGVLEAYATA